MAGELVPLVLLPRYTTYAGRSGGSPPYQYFATIGMDVTQYERAIVNFWRGKIVGSAGTPPYVVAFEESTDQDSWTACEGSPDGTDPTYPAENVEIQYVLTLKKRWFRVKVTLGDDDNVVSCWAVGFLEERVR